MRFFIEWLMFKFGFEGSSQQLYELTAVLVLLILLVTFSAALLLWVYKS